MILVESISLNSIPSLPSIMEKHIAVIDCGTNTFTLSLFEVQTSGKFKRTIKKRHYVELAEEGIHEIGPKAFERGLNAFRDFRDFLDDYPEIKAFALGTAALRRAANKIPFLQEVENVSGIRIQIIDGDREADLIYKGVHLAAPLEASPSLIMDIGGGSVEFIIANNQELLWAKSYPIGGAVLFDKFHQSDPISTLQIEALEQHLEEELQELSQLLEEYDIQHLIGASGSFDVLDNLTGAKGEEDLYGFISAEEFKRLYHILVPSTFQERLSTRNLSNTSAKLIVMSVLLINFVHQKIGSDQLIASDHAMREGLVFEILSQ